MGDLINKPKQQLIVSVILNDQRIIETVYSKNSYGTQLALSDGNKTTLVKSFTENNKSSLTPISPSNNLIKHEAILFAEQPESYVSIESLIADIQEYIYRYVDLSDQFRKIASYYVLLTWVYDVFNELPYLRLRGDYGSGKTRALFVIGSLCNKAFFASGASTVSPIFHILDTFRGTLIFDEADFRFSDEKSELVKIFNNGNVRGFPVLRTAITAKREFDPRAFDVFGPKIVAMRKTFDDPALESRFLTEEMGQKQMRKDIPINLPDIQKDEALYLRNRLLMYRFRMRNNIKIDNSLYDTRLSPRINQILTPLLSLIENQKLNDDIKEAVMSFEQNLNAERASSPEAGVLEVIHELSSRTEKSLVPISEITEVFVKKYGKEYDRIITNRYIGGILRKRLRLTTYKSHGIYVMPISEKHKIDELCIRYGVVDRGELVTSTNG